jgi:hypothetical protein
MINYLLKLKVENILIIPNIFQDNLTQYQGSKGHSAISDVRWKCTGTPIAVNKHDYPMEIV